MRTPTPPATFTRKLAGNLLMLGVNGFVVAATLYELCATIGMIFAQ